MLLYGFGPSRSTRISWALEEVGSEWKYYKLDFRSAEHRGETYQKINPGGKVPALVDGEVVLTESLAIVTYLGERFPDSGLVPIDLAERAQYFRWCAFAISELEQPLWTLGKHSFALPEKHRVPEIKKTARYEFNKALDVLSLGLSEKDFILGENFSGADILLGHTLSWARAREIPIEQENINSYADRTHNRPAYTRGYAREVDAPTGEFS